MSLKPNELKILRGLTRQGGQSVHEVTLAAKFSIGYVRDQLRLAELRGLVVTSLGGDKRKVFWHLTEMGEAAVYEEQKAEVRV